LGGRGLHTTRRIITQIFLRAAFDVVSGFIFVADLIATVSLVSHECCGMQTFYSEAVQWAGCVAPVNGACHP